MAMGSLPTAPISQITDEEQPEDAEEVVFGGPTGRTGTYGSTEDQKHLKCERGGEEWTLQPRR